MASSAARTKVSPIAGERAAAPDRRSARDWCERYTREHQENFTVVSWFLPRELRGPMFAVYAFCRYTDDLGDEAAGDRLALLDEWEAELRAAFGGAPTHPITVALADVAQSKPLEPEPFLRLIEANRLDQRKSRYADFQELLGYCRLSANPVGEMVLALWEITDDERRRLSDATCTALQLANHWQDVRRDWEAGRLYLPLDDLRRFGLGEDDIAEQIAAGRAERDFRELMRFQVDRAEAYFRLGDALVRLVPRELAVDLRLFSDGGRAALRAIERQGYDVLAARPRVSSARRVRLALRAAAALKLGSAAGGA